MRICIIEVIVSNFHGFFIRFQTQSFVHYNFSAFSGLSQKTLFLSDTFGTANQSLNKLKFD